MMKLTMSFHDALHIARNPFGYSEHEYKQAVLEVCEYAERYRTAHLNMRDWAESNGVDVYARNTPDTGI